MKTGQQESLRPKEAVSMWFVCEIDIFFFFFLFHVSQGLRSRAQRETGPGGTGTRARDQGSTVAYLGPEYIEGETREAREMRFFLARGEVSIPMLSCPLCSFSFSGNKRFGRAANLGGSNRRGASQHGSRHSGNARDCAHPRNEPPRPVFAGNAVYEPRCCRRHAGHVARVGHSFDGKSSHSRRS